MAKLIGKQPFHGLRYEGKRFDCGDKAGYLEAQVAFALKQPRPGAGDAEHPQDLWLKASCRAGCRRRSATLPAMAAARLSPPGRRRSTGCRLLRRQCRGRGEFAVTSGDDRNEANPENAVVVAGLPDSCMETHFAYGSRVGL